MSRLCEHKDVPEAILDATGRLLERYGYKKMTIDDIAQEAGIGKGTIYSYFPSKQEIALSWTERANGILINELNVIADGDDSPEDKLRNILIRRIMFRFDNAQHFLQSFDDIMAPVKSMLVQRREKNTRNEGSILARVIESGCQSGVMRCDDPQIAGYCMALATNSLLPYSLTPAEMGERRTIHEYALNITNLLIYGLAVR
jgi:AcrR family transcriptional regulator